MSVFCVTGSGSENQKPGPGVLDRDGPPDEEYWGPGLPLWGRAFVFVGSGSWADGVQPMWMPAVPSSVWSPLDGHGCILINILQRPWGLVYCPPL